MSADEKLQAGEINEALDELKDQIRKDPSDPKLRVFMFQLFALTGDWGRALTQLNVAGEMDPSAIAMMQVYQSTLGCESLRAKVFEGEKSPLLFGKPEEWLALVLDQAKRAGQGQHEEAAKIRDQAFEAAPATSGTILVGKEAPEKDPDGNEPEGEPFEWIADADPRMGPTIEVIMNGKYYWIPFNRIRRIDIEPPADLRDLVWAPAHFEWANGGEAVGFIPTRYPGSEASDDHAIRMARKTEWVSPAEDVYMGMGQRMLTTDQGDYPLLEIRRLVLNVEAEPDDGKNGADTEANG